jgi:hypothetical protein
VGALEGDEFLRAAWGVMVAERVEAERLVFVSSMGVEGMGPSLTVEGVEGSTTSLGSSKPTWSGSWLPRCAGVGLW